MRRTAPVQGPVEISGWVFLFIGVLLVASAIAFAGGGDGVQKPQDGVPPQTTKEVAAPTEVHLHTESDGWSPSSIILAVGTALGVVITAGGIAYWRIKSKPKEVEAADV